MHSYGSARVMSRRSAFTGLAAGALIRSAPVMPSSGNAPVTTTVVDPGGQALRRVTGMVRAKRITVQPLASPRTGTPAA